MALKLRKAIFQKAFIHGALTLIASTILSALVLQTNFSVAIFVWLFLLACATTMLSAYLQFSQLLKRFHPMQNGILSYQKLERQEKMLNGIEIDWEAMAESAEQLRNLGYSHLGDFTPMPQDDSGVCLTACYLDAAAAILVSVQYVVALELDSQGQTVLHEGVHYSIESLLGGNIRVCTSNYKASGTRFLLRGQYDVIAFYPNLPLRGILEKHRRMLSNVQKRTNKLVSTGLNIERHVLLLRERLAFAAARLERMGGLAIAQEVDAFEAQPQYKWAPPSTHLAALPVRVLEDFDQSELARQQDLLLTDVAQAG